MDEPGWEWPAWKFGMKREDLFGRLHDQYNTVASAIQDPEAFHHDVFEISHLADTSAEFDRLMAARKAQRLRELNESLESAAVEIIANPKLIGTDQWQFALQLFRTKSLDSLVRYFASYLPDDHSYRHHHYDSPSSTGSFASETCSVHTASTKPSTIDDIDIPSTVSFFPDGDDKPIMTHEPLTITTSAITAALSAQLLPSPRSMTMRSDVSVSSRADDFDIHDYTVNTCTPARTLSFSDSESERFTPADREECCHRHLHHDSEEEEEVLETSQSDFEETLITSESDLTDSHSSLESVPEVEETPLSQLGKDEVDDDEFPPAQLPSDSFDTMESETPTPRQESHTASYMDSKPLYRAYRATSPRLRRREGSPMAKRSPEESLSRIQKPMPDPTRSRPKGRRWVAPAEC
jgi:hypothetical protein